MLDFPAAVLMCRLTLWQTLQGFSAQIGWFIVMETFRRLLWHWGMSRYAAVGL
jgi:ABC-type uncharacterized transport system permease subunit